MQSQDTKALIDKASTNIDWKSATDFNSVRKNANKYNKQISDLEIRDKSFQITTRKTLLIYFLILLGIQNIAVFILVLIAYSQNKLDHLSPIISIIVTGTIIETICVLKIIVSKTFSHIKYKYHSN